MEKTSTDHQDPILQKPFRYNIRLVIHLFLTTLLYSLYYHNIPFLVNEDDGLSNAMNTFELFTRDRDYRDHIQSYFYDVVPISSLSFLWLSDLLGRKQVLQYSLKWNCVFLFFSLISLSVEILILANLFLGLNFSIGLVQAYLLMTESVKSKDRDLLSAILFASWGVSFFITNFLCSLEIGWRPLTFFMILLNFYCFWTVSRLVESPEYFKNAGNFSRADESYEKILENQSENGDWDVVERLKAYDGIFRYFKDFGAYKKFLFVLWINSGMIYDSLSVADIKIAENLYLNGMIKAFFITAALGMVYFQRKFGRWKMTFGAVLITRLASFFLAFVGEDSMSQKFFYILAESSLTYEIFCLFGLTDHYLKGRSKSKIFGLLIFSSLSLNYLSKDSIFNESKSTPRLFITSLLSSSSLLILYFFMNSTPSETHSTPVLKAPLFELKPLN